MNDARQPRDRLPPEVYRLALQWGADPQLRRSTVCLRQSGRMRQDARSGWMRFRARQTISLVACAFAWHARTGPAGIISVRDTLTQEGGRLDVRALGLIPIARGGGSEEVTRGQLIRYLAELAWAPDAILSNPELRWRCDGPRRLIVGAGTGAASAEVVLSLDSSLRIAEAFAPDRPRAVQGSFIPTPWRGRFADYRRHQGRILPFTGEVGWLNDGVDVVSWQGRIERWDVKAG